MLGSIAQSQGPPMIPADSFPHNFMDQLAVQDPHRDTIDLQGEHYATEINGGLFKHDTIKINQIILITGIIALLLALSLSVYALRHFSFRVVRFITADSQPSSLHYSDKDGIAAPKLSRHAAGWPLCLAILVAIAGGTVTSSLRAGLVAQHFSSLARYACWTKVGIWVCMLLQSASLALSRSAPACFAISWRTGVCAALLLVVLISQVYGVILSESSTTIWTILAGIEALLGAMTGLLCILVPRRPDVFYKGAIVDRQFTTSLLGWVSFSWAETVLRMAERSPSLKVKDLPELDHHTRGETTYTNWKSNLPTSDRARGLWWTILRSHKALICAQVTITFLQSILAFVPQLAMLRILILLEERSRDDGVDKLLVPVLGLGLSVMASATLETFKYWISYNKLVIRVRQQLSLTIFDKTVRLSGFSNPSQPDSVSPADETHSPVNLVAVDVQNVVDFLCFSFLIYESPLKLGLALTFLIRLLGWESVLVGLGVLLLLTLVNILAGRKYARLQDMLMRFRDRRVRAIGEMLQGIHQIKFSAHESQWQDKVNQLRNTEMGAQWAVCRWQILFVSMSLITPIMLSATCLSVFVLLSGHLSAATAFTSIAVLASIEVSMTILPDILALLLNARVSMQRIGIYLGQPEREIKIIPSKEISLNNVTVAWPRCSEGRGVLRGLNLRFPRSALSIVTGPTGSGKSLLLAAILGEADVLDGRLSAPLATSFEELSHPPDPTHWLMDSALAFVSQTPWLQNTTVKENILFRLPFDEARYASVVFACALHDDFAVLPSGDETQINSKGSNLSGGQKWRVSLARALYSRARTLVMDDIFSALDVHTREHVHRHVLCGTLLHERTCILVTHHLDLCGPHAKYVVHLENGALKSANVTSQIIHSDTGAPVRRDKASHPEEGSMQVSEYRRRHSNVSESSRLSLISTDSGNKEEEEVSGSFTSRQGAVSIFVREGANLIQWLILGVAFLAYGGFMLSRAWWIHLWTDNYKEVASMDLSPHDHHPVYYWLAIYLGLSALACILGTCRTYLSLSAALRASQNLFRKMLSATLHAPLQWHEQVPLGNILSRFTADISVLDMRVGDDLRATLEYSMDVMMAIVAGAIVNPFLLGISGLLLALYFWCARRFIAASRHLKVLENAAKAPPLEYIDNIFNGLSTVRAFGQANIAMQQFCTEVSYHARAYWHLWLLNRWLGFRINVLGATFSAISAAMVVYTPGVSPSTAGFAITFTIEVSLTMALSIRRYVNLEQGLNSMSRIHSYATVQKEENLDSIVQPDSLESWPQRGMLEVSDLVVKHASHLPPVLHGVSFTAKPGTRVGVVGRTGAGKSSLVLALFRFLNATHGKIVVDDVDISQVPLQILRSRLAIIPQHPVLFRGTVRSNLDQFDEYDNDTLLNALRAVGWQELDSSISCHPGEVSALSESLFSSSNITDTNSMADDNSSDAEENTPLLEETPNNIILSQSVTDCGENLSHGQRQLLCLARAIVRRPKIMILDEATASVDKATDSLIQRSLHSALGHGQTTLLVIAHRLKTVADADTVLVLDSGRIVEYGSPRELLQRENGHFRGMVEQDPERAALEELILTGMSE